MHNFFVINPTAAMASTPIAVEVTIGGMKLSYEVRVTKHYSFLIGRMENTVEIQCWMSQSYTWA